MNRDAKIDIFSELQIQKDKILCGLKIVSKFLHIDRGFYFFFFYFCPRKL